MNLFRRGNAKRFVFAFFFFITAIESIHGTYVTSHTTHDSSSPLAAVFNHNLFTNLQNINYSIDRELFINIPGTNHNLTISWGFGGSGSIFEPLAGAPIRLNAATTGVQTNAPFNIETLSAMLINDGFSNTTSQLPILQWIHNKQLSPLNVFFIKIFLLIKDYKRNLYDITFVRTEVTRLLIRLSLSSDKRLMSAASTISLLMPSAVKDAINSIAPDLMTTIDSIWKNITLQQHAMTIEEFKKSLPRTVFACAFANKDEADTCFEMLRKDAPEHITHRDDVHIFKGILATSHPVDMPEALKREAQQAHNLPTLIRAQDTTGQTWVGYVTDRLDLLDTSKMLSTVLITTMQKYISARKHYLKHHSQAHDKQNDHYTKQQLKAQRIHTFLNTEAGKASLNRIAKALEAVHNHTVQAQHTAPQHPLEYQLQALHKLRTQQEQAQAILKGYDKTFMGHLTHASAIRTLEADIAQRQKTIDSYEQHIHKYQQETSFEKRTQNLNELYRIATNFKNNGLPLPIELVTMIKDAEKQLNPDYVPCHPNNNPNQSINNFIDQRDAIAIVYEKEVVTLKAELQKLFNQRVAHTTGALRHAIELEFNELVKPQYEAYWTSLKEQAHALIDQNSKIEALMHYRNLIKLDDKKLSSEKKKHHQELEYEVGWIVDERSTEGVIHSFLRSNDIQEFITDVFGDKSTFKDVREYFINTLSIVLQKSDHINAIPSTYSYLLEKFAPATYKKFFDTIIRETAV